MKAWSESWWPVAGESKVFTLRLSLGCLLAMLVFLMYSNIKMLNSNVKASPGSKADAESGRALPLAAKASDNVEEQPLVTSRGNHAS